MTTTNETTKTAETVGVMAIGKGLVHAGSRNTFGWSAACTGHLIGGDYDVITESASHINCARCLKRLGRGLAQ